MVSSIHGMPARTSILNLGFQDCSIMDPLAIFDKIEPLVRLSDRDKIGSSLFTLGI